MKATFKRILVAAAVATVAAVGSTAVSSAPAAASTPACTKVGNWQGRNIWVPASSGGSFDCHLQRGYASPAVSQLQVTLKSCYGRNIAVDGVFGYYTYSALKSVQQQIGTTADGVYGPATRRKMKFVAWGTSGCAYAG